jgi:serine/threonine protein kinase
VTVVAPAHTADTVVSEDATHLAPAAQQPVSGAVRVSGAPEPDTIIHGVYRIIDKLASGGMGVVMLARDEHLERLVAIKLVRPELLDDGALRSRFLLEARAMASVRDPNVVQIYAFGEHWGAPYFVMEYVEGSTVQTWLNELHGAAPDLELALRMLDDACRGLSAIHAAGAIHRDIKPSNLLLDRSFRLRVADFGVADLHPRAVLGDKREIVGTPEFMAPEIVKGTPVEPELAERADVYSLACVAFEMLTGTPPFAAEDARSRMMAHVEREPPRPSDVRPDLPTEIDDVILRALAKDPAKRTPSVEAFRRGLLAAAERSTEPVRILLADDDADFCQLLSLSLEREFPGVEIRTAANGSEALEAFDREPHSVAILDLQMPGLDGMELTGLLRARDVEGKVPIVVITANGGASEWKRLSEMGADGFLVKPVHAKDVVTLVRRALSERRSSPRSVR